MKQQQTRDTADHLVAIQQVLTLWAVGITVVGLMVMHWSAQLGTLGSFGAMQASVQADIQDTFNPGIPVLLRAASAETKQ